MTEPKKVTRADLVRQRRSQRSTQELARTTERAVKPASKVTSRVGTSYVQEKHKRVEHKTRRFNIALGLPQINLHTPTPKLPRPQGSWRTTSMVFAALLGVALYLLWTLTYFRVPAATVLGNSRLTVEEINSVLGVTGESIFVVQPEEVATRLRLNYPELASAQVNVYLPNHVYVTVAERQPVILWQQGDGYTWVDATGVAFRPRGEVSGLAVVNGLANPPAGLPFTEDPLSPPAFIEKELVDAILVLAPHVPAGSTLTYDPMEGLGWKDSRGWVVYFGTGAQGMPLKLRVYESLVNSLVARGTVPAYVNVAYVDAPYYRMPVNFEETETTLNVGQ